MGGEEGLFLGPENQCPCCGGADANHKNTCASIGPHIWQLTHAGMHITWRGETDNKANKDLNSAVSPLQHPDLGNHNLLDASVCAACILLRRFTESRDAKRDDIEMLCQGCNRKKVVPILKKKKNYQHHEMSLFVVPWRVSFVAVGWQLLVVLSSTSKLHFATHFA